VLSQVRPVSEGGLELPRVPETRASVAAKERRGLLISARRRSCRGCSVNEPRGPVQLPSRQALKGLRLLQRSGSGRPPGPAPLAAAREKSLPAASSARESPVVDIIGLGSRVRTWRRESAAALVRCQAVAAVGARELSSESVLTCGNIVEKVGGTPALPPRFEPFANHP